MKTKPDYDLYFPLEHFKNKYLSADAILKALTFQYTADFLSQVKTGQWKMFWTDLQNEGSVWTHLCVCALFECAPFIPEAL